MSGHSTTVAVVLAAGLSQRFGGDKLLAPLQGKPLAAHIAATVAGLEVTQRIAICSASEARQAIFAAQGFETIENAEPRRGMASSLALAAQRAWDLDAERMLVCLADMPFVTAAHLHLLLATKGNVVATAAEGVRSPPVVFSREVFPALTQLTGDTGARHLLQAAAGVETTPAMVRDFDLPSDFRQAGKQL